MALIVSVSGIRGIVGTELTPEVVYRFAAAFAVQRRGRIGVGSDGRPSGLEIKKAVFKGLTESKCDVVDFGILPTPTFGYLVREGGLAGGIQITASHNPAQYNGLKLFGGDGAVLPPQQGEIIKAAFERFDPTASIWGHRGTVHEDSKSWLAHIISVMRLVDHEAIKKRAFRVVLDGNGGAGGPTAIALLKSFGCTMVQVACEPLGQFLHEPEPTPENLRSVEAIVRNNPGYIGACLDPDADRLVMIDETGHCLSEELTLALAIQSRLRKAQGPVVINLSTSRVTEDVAKAAGVPCYRSAVGEANVVAKMREVSGLIGGEGNGGVIDPRVGWVRDPFIGIGLILELMAETNQTLTQLAAALPKYVIQKDKVTLPAEWLPVAFDLLTRQWPDAKIDLTDGLRFDWPDRWIHVRASNTEPIVRVIAETPDADSAKELCQTGRQLIQSALPS